MKEETRNCNVHGKVIFVQGTNGKWTCRKCNVDGVIRYRQNLKKMAIEYKGGKCEKCGYSKCVYALEFHHTDKNKKDMSIAGSNKGWEKMKKELDKCILVCSNCHRELHAAIGGNRK